MAIAAPGGGNTWPDRRSGQRGAEIEIMRGGHMRHMRFRKMCAGVVASLAVGFFSPGRAIAADHNDPNAANSIFSDIQPSPADLYDLYGFPIEDAGGERVVVALTFASAPSTGVLDPDLLYRVLLAPGARVGSGIKDEDGLEGMLKYVEALKDKYARMHPSEVRVTVDAQGKARLQFFKLPGGDFS